MLMRKALMLLFLIAPTLLSAQEKGDSLETPAPRHELGVAAGFTTAYGLSYRFWPCELGFQAAFAPFKNNTTVRYHAGLTLMYRLLEGENTHLFLYQGNHFRYVRQRPGIYVTPIQERDATRRYFNNGLGIGFEFVIVDRVELSLMGGYGAFENFQRFNVTGEAGLFYRF